MEVKTKSYTNLIESLLKRHGLSGENLIFTPNVQTWAREHNLTEHNPFRVAMAARRSGTNDWDIVIKEEISENDINSITSAMSLRGFGRKIEKIKDPIKFLEHLILHEIAHTKGIRQEGEADEWAFTQLGIKTSKRHLSS